MNWLQGSPVRVWGPKTLVVIALNNLWDDKKGFSGGALLYILFMWHTICEPFSGRVHGRKHGLFSET